MSDIADIAAEESEVYMDAKLRGIDPNRLDAPVTGRCLHCDAALAYGHRWCNAQCRDYWEQDDGC